MNPFLLRFDKNCRQYNKGSENHEEKSNPLSSLADSSEQAQNMKDAVFEGSAQGLPFAQEEGRKEEICKDSETTPMKIFYYNNIIFKKSNYGGIMIANGTNNGTAYTIVSTNIDTSRFCYFDVKLDFSCNIIAAQPILHLNFQILKQDNCQLISVPVSANYIFSRTEEKAGSDIFSLNAYDRDSIKSKCCNYSVCLRVIGAGAEAEGTAMIANAVLLATIIEKSCKI